MFDRLAEMFDNMFGGYDSLPDASPENMGKIPSPQLAQPQPTNKSDVAE